MARGCDFHKAIKKLNARLIKKKPKTFNPSWLKLNAGTLYKYLCKNVQNEIGGVDWDLVTVNLDRTFQKRWMRYEQKTKNTPYENRAELNSILTKYQNKLYTLMAPQDKQDKKIQDQIMISLVRNAQKGNVLAKDHVLECVTFIIYEWIENSRYMVKWKGYTDVIGERIQGCIRNYRYSGSFMNYVFRTFQYSARGLRPTFSLDDRFHNGAKRRIDYVVQEDDY